MVVHEIRIFIGALEVRALQGRNISMHAIDSLSVPASYSAALACLLGFMYDSEYTAMKNHSFRYHIKVWGVGERADGGGHGLEKLGEAECRETKHGAL